MSLVYRYQHKTLYTNHKEKLHNIHDANLHSVHTVYVTGQTVQSTKREGKNNNTKQQKIRKKKTCIITNKN